MAFLLLWKSSFSIFDSFETPDIKGLSNLNDFTVIERIFENRISGYTQVDFQDNKFFVYNNGKIYILNQSAKPIREIDVKKKLKGKVKYITSISAYENDLIFLADHGLGKVYLLDLNYENGKIKELNKLNKRVKKPLSVKAWNNKLIVFDSDDARLKIFRLNGEIMSSHKIVYRNIQAKYINGIDGIKNTDLLVLSDSNNGRVLLFDMSEKKPVREIKGFLHPRGIDAVDESNILVADVFSGQVVIFDSKGDIKERIMPTERIQEDGWMPFDVCFAEKNGSLVVSDRLFGRIYFWGL